MQASHDQITLIGSELGNQNGAFDRPAVGRHGPGRQLASKSIEDHIAVAGQGVAPEHFHAMDDLHAGASGRAASRTIFGSTRAPAAARPSPPPTVPAALRW